MADYDASPDRSGPISASRFLVNEWTVDPERLRVRRGAETRRVEPKVMALLTVLAERPGAVWTRDALLDRVWPDTVVLDHALTRTVSELRALLDDTAREERVVETIPTRGYRLAAAVRPLPDRPTVSRPVPSARPSPDRPSPTRSSSARSSSALPSSARRTPVAARLLAAISATGLLVLLLAWMLDAPPAPSPTTMRPITSTPGLDLFPALSTDGRWVAFARKAEDGGVFVSLVDAPHPLRLTDTDADAFPRFVDGDTHVAFQRVADDQCAILRVPVTGGPPQHLADCPAARGGLGWDVRDGRFVVPGGGDGRGLALLSSSGGTPVTLTQPADQALDLFPVVAPDGRQVAFLRGRRPGEADVYVVPLSLPPGTSHNEAQVRRITELGQPIAGIAWSSDGERLILATSTGGPFSMHAVSVRTGTLRPLPLPSTDDYSAPSIGGNDRLALAKWAYDTNVLRVPLSPSPAAVAPVSASAAMSEAGLPPGARRVVAGTRSDDQAALHPDGQRLAFVSDRTGTRQVWTAQADGAAPHRLTDFSGGVWGAPAWTPDGQSLVVEVRVAGGSRIARVDRSGAWSWLTDGPRDAAPSVSPDGQTLLFGSQRSGTWQIWTQPMDGGPPRPLTRSGGYTAKLSPDGATLFVQRMTEPGLWAVAMPEVDGDDGPPAPRRLYADLRPAPLGAWTVTANGAVLVQRMAAHWIVDSVDPSSGTASPVLDLPSLQVSGPSSLSASPTGDALWLSVHGALEADVVVVDGAVGR